MKSWTMILARILIVLALAFSLSCASQNASGECRDYEPFDFCQEDTVYACQTNDKGCRTCSCVSPDEARYLETHRR